MRLKGKKIVILVEDLYDVMEMWVPYYRMLEEGAEVIKVGSGSASVYSSKHLVSLLVPVVIIVTFEVIDIAHQ